MLEYMKFYIFSVYKSVQLDLIELYIVNRIKMYNKESWACESINNFEIQRTRSLYEYIHTIIL